ncbi:hypothetical protein DL89DRAFT_123748 [Linderina pennispora]|uniref:Kinetochore protein Spc24 n=1 Tax=Linderina pennispora TaxID=61395 RepID=A0A1Y1WCT7_9FUNG|nr:uncharacterized protein DL89DRAFT_123748 [Linderina pennispora]ORX71349.1 hypothetical protein DL89DRAFT_123748 [Linderina pennispora]
MTTSLWVNKLKSQYLEQLQKHAKDIPTDVDSFPENIHTLIDYYSTTYAKNRDTLLAYQAREIFAERIRGSAFIPRTNELEKLEAQVVEEERLLDQVQQRLLENIGVASDKIDAECDAYEEALALSQQNQELLGNVSEIEEEIAKLSKELEEKEQREQDAVAQQTRELQIAHNDVMRETAACEELDREAVRLRERAQQLKSDEKKRMMTADDSQEQQKLVMRWIRSIAPVVSAKVENSTLILTIGEGVGDLSSRRILVGFNNMGQVTSVETDSGRKLPPVLSHDVLMQLLSE